jgi:CRP-like cAMP-binding protein
MPQHRSAAKNVTSRLLAGVDPAAHRTIMAAARKRRLRPSQYIYRVGEPAEELFVLSSGRAQLGRPARTGRELMMGILAPGDVFGIASLLVGGGEYMGTAKAMEATEVLVWDRDAMQRFARTHPQLTSNALRVALAFVAQFAERHELLIAATAEHRLARALTRLGAQTDGPATEGVEVRITNEQLGSLADVSSYTASRQLNKWAREGAVRKHRGTVQILDPDQLLPR